jgi:uncharacterized membrane protein
MHAALIILGVLIGFILGNESTTFFAAVLGAAAGYAAAELIFLRRRNEWLEKELNTLKEHMVLVQRRLRAGQAEAAAGEPAAKTAGSAGGPPDAVPGATLARGVHMGPSQRSGSATAAVTGSSGMLGAGGVPAAGTPDLASGWARAAQAGVNSEAALGAPRAFEPYAASGTPTAHGVSGSPTSGGYSPAADVPDEPAFLKVVREYFTGGNTVVRVGILILFFGVAFLLRYVAEHSHVPIQIRLSAVAFGGFVLLALGWRLRGKRRGYALALQGGGVGILYLTVFAALRLYSLMPPSVAFAIFVSLAAFTAALAVVQNSQSFAFLAVTGGFLAPILATTGEGNHIALFSYYVVLNAVILAISWYKTWRPLNLAGFAFTFIISAAWGALRYKSELFASTEPFLVLFFVFYVAIAVLFSLRQTPQLRGYVDGTLVFGTPIAAFGYQSAMLHDRHLALALSAVVVGVFYFALAAIFHRLQRSFQRLLIESFMALGVVFLTVATPLALSGTATGVTWVLEGAALVWIGARQHRVLPRLFGVLLQFAAALIQINDADRFLEGMAPPFGLYLARAVTAFAAVLSAVLLRKYAERLRPYEAAASPVLFFLGVAEWLFCGFIEIDRQAPDGYRLSLGLVLVTVTALACSELSRRTALTLARVPALCLLPALLVFAALSLIPPVHHPCDHGGWLAWPLAFAGFYVICRRHEGEPDESLANWLHVVSAWLLVALLTWQVDWFIDQGVAGRGSWPAVGWMLIPACVLFLLPRGVERLSWPLRTHREAYLWLAGGGVALYLAFWSLGTNLSLPGDPYPFPYVPLLNILDLAQVLVLAVLWRFWLFSRSAQRTPDLDLDDAPAMTALSALAFIWLNAALIRALHRWADVPLDFDAVIRSTLVQTALSIFWTVLALATMLVATRRASRVVWITGACLLGATIVKLFAVDLSHVGTVERIVSFVGVGLLTLVIGYFSPLPPVATSHRTTVS